jgi:hypothetical protein
MGANLYRKHILHMHAKYANRNGNVLTNNMKEILLPFAKER